MLMEKGKDPANLIATIQGMASKVHNVYFLFLRPAGPQLFHPKLSDSKP